MARGLIAAGLISGAGQGMKEVGAQMQRAMDAKELDAARQRAEDLRQQRTIEAQRGMQREGLTAQAESQERGFEHTERMAQERMLFEQELSDRGFIQKGKELKLKERELSILDEKLKMSKDEFATVTDSSGRVQIYDREKKFRGTLLGEDGKPILVPKDVSQSTLKAVDVILEQMRDVSRQLSNHLLTPEQQTGLQNRLDSLGRQARGLLGTTEPTAQAVDPQVKAYADKYYGGDVNAALNAIAQQRGAKATPQSAPMPGKPGLLRPLQTPGQLGVATPGGL